jgi:predicted nucleotidyltransferase
LTDVPDQVMAVVADYLSVVDESVSLYLVGSVALNDFRPGASDIDFVAVTDEPVDLDAIRRVHGEVTARHPRPYFDGLYTTWSELARDPRHVAPGVQVHEHTVHASTRGERHPVTWHTLAQCGVAVRGPEKPDVWTDAAVLAESVRENLDAYWRVWHRKESRLGLATFIDWGPAWAVLGVSRLHYTLTTGRITSKYEAGVHARKTFPAEWHRIVDECLRIRRGEPGPSRYRSRWARRRDALSFLDFAITEAHAIP